MAKPVLEHISLFNMTIHKATANDIVNIVQYSITNNERYIIAHHNLHSIYLCLSDTSSHMRRFYNHATYNIIDGMSLIVMANLLGHSFTSYNRTTMIDLIPCLLNHAAISNWRTYYLGTKQDIVENGATILRNTFKGLDIRFHNGYFDTLRNSHENIKIVSSINEYSPNILMVGMGMPRQEEWIIQNFEQLRVNTILSTGAYIDYIAGDKPIPPRWLGPIGLEWLYRLLREPRRLGKRYLLEPWLLLELLIRDTCHHRGLTSPVRRNHKNLKSQGVCEKRKAR